MLVDSHCHLDYIVSRNPDDSIKDIIDRAVRNDVKHLLSVCIDLDQFNTLRDIAATFDNVNITVGVHPTDVDPENIVTKDRLIELATNDYVVAFGETGLDYYHDESNIAAQKTSFRSHIEASIATKKPLVIHARDAFADIFRILNDYKGQNVTGVMHCFTGTLQEAMQAIEMGFYISFSGIITFKNARELHQVAASLPLDKLLIETDSPYLAPMPYRGKINEPAYVKYVAQALADLHGVSIDKVASITTDNFYSLFKC